MRFLRAGLHPGPADEVYIFLQAPSGLRMRKLFHILHLINSFGLSTLVRHVRLVFIIGELLQWSVVVLTT